VKNVLFIGDVCNGCPLWVLPWDYLGHQFRPIYVRLISFTFGLPQFIGPTSPKLQFTSDRIAQRFTVDVTETYVM